MTVAEWRTAAAALAICLASGAPAAAQQSGTVQGRVVESGTARPLANARVRIDGTSIGALTNSGGRFQLANVPSGTQSLRVESFGYAAVTQQVTVTSGQSTTIDVELQVAAVNLDEVVVTALGVERQRRAVPYAVAEVKAMEITQAAPVTAATAIYGKAAGVQIAQGSSGPTGGINITIRGVKSITGSNRPLIIVDGIPIHDQNSGYAEWDWNRDLGSGINNINPRDIESLQVLKGATAAALYGAQAANGVVLIQTKRGAASTGAGVEFSTSVTADEIAHLPKFQNVFGAGLGWFSLQNRANDGSFRLADDGTPVVTPTGNSFGPRMEGQMVRWWDGKMRPFEPQPDNFKNLYDRGHNIVNSVALSNATERATYRLGYTRTDWAGVFPGNRQDRNTVTLAGDLKISDRLTTELAVNYYNTETRNPPPKWYMAYSFPRSLRSDMLRSEYKTPDGFQIRLSDFPLLHSGEERMLREFYWTGLEEQFEHDQDHLIASLGANYQFNDWLNLRLRAGADDKNADQEIRQPSTQPESMGPSGRFGIMKQHDRVNYGELMLTARRQLMENLGVDFLAGAATTRAQGSLTSIDTQGGLVVRDWFSIDNSKNKPSEDAWRGKERTDGVFASAQFSFRDFLYLNATGRNDWTSTLPPDANSYFYPSVGASFVFSDAIQLPEFLSYGQLRANYAEVGRGARRYQANRAYIYDNWEGVTTNRFLDVVPPTGLKPERKQEFELGLNVAFLNNRLGVDAAFYHERNVDQIIDLEVPHSSGARAITVNNGLMTNTGLEVQLNATPVSTRAFQWNTTVNLARNQNEVKQLAAGLESLVLQNVEDNLYVEARPGRPFGEIYGKDFRRAPDGRKIVDGNGFYAKDDTLSLVGNITPDLTGGVINNLRYGDFSLTGVVDFRAGGDIIAMTNYYGYATGKWEETLGGRSQEYGGLPYYIDDSGNYVQLASHDAQAPDGRQVYHDGRILPGVQEVFDAAGKVVGYEENDQLVPTFFYYAINYEWKGQGIYPQIVYDNSYIKLRELVLSYRVPANWATRLGLQDLQLSLIGRNLAFFYKNVPHIDPESSRATDSSLQGVEHYEAYHPSTRSIGFAVHARF
jgi:iron complex outermembrane receptor protein